MSENALSPWSGMLLALSLYRTLSLARSLCIPLSFYSSHSRSCSLKRARSFSLWSVRTLYHSLSLSLSFSLRGKGYRCKSGKAYAISVRWHARITFFFIIIIIPKLLLTASAAASSTFILCVQQHHICSVCRRLEDYPPCLSTHEGFVLRASLPSVRTCRATLINPMCRSDEGL